MSISSQDLYEIAGLNSDGVAGFEAQLRLKTARTSARVPAHFIGSRVSNFERGAEIARSWLSRRKGVGDARRSARQAELKATGAMTILRGNAAETRAEQLQTLREVVASLRLETSEL